MTFSHRIEMNDKTPTPYFDAHVHYSLAYLDQTLAAYKRFGIAGSINLWASTGGLHGIGACDYRADYEEFLKEIRRRRLDTMVQFCWPVWSFFGWQGERFVQDLVQKMKRYDRLGCRGVKVWKDLGMGLFFADGTPVLMNDRRLDPVWKTAEDLDWTVAVHQADPSRSFTKLPRTGLTREQLFAIRDEVVARHPGLRFILCHSGNDIESVPRWAALMDRFPNVLCDVSRDPLAIAPLEDVAPFLRKYADRLMLGTDLMSPAERPTDVAWCLAEWLPQMWQTVRSWQMDDVTFQKITHGTAEKIFLRQ
jgi:predicted TIM-barrel fold metal-dependent hydrolase